MKILTQDRSAMIELPKEIWATCAGEDHRGLVVGTSDHSSTMGIYGSIDRALAVVKEIFDYYRNGKKTYVMPEK